MGAGSKTVLAIGGALLAVATGGSAAAAIAAPSSPIARGAQGPILAGSPWPEMRNDMRNTGYSPIRGRYRGGRPWSFTTGRGIFSTAVIDDRGNAYVGSADNSFYALGPNGDLLWRFRTGGIIDAAAALGARTGGGGFPITIGSGDETLYQLDGKRGKLSRERRIRWTYRSPLAPVTGQLVNWWEGNVAYGPDGNLYVGNTGGGAYSLTNDGQQRWILERDNSVWTTPAFDAQGNSYWGSVDLFAFSADPQGQLRWQTFTPGYVTSSPTLGSDGTVYVGSFDHDLYALDPSTGDVRWRSSTGEHIYSSPALVPGPDGATAAIVVGSADGSIYAVDTAGHELWRYDTGEPVRSSPVVGRAPRGDGLVVYVGSSSGSLYALDAETGSRRWSFDTTSERAETGLRNDLNASPALGKRGIFIGGEEGLEWFVPYDYCLEHRDRRCSTDPGEDFGAELDRAFVVDPGGQTLGRTRVSVPPATTLATRLIVRSGGRTLDAAMDPSVSVTSDPGFDFETQLSGDGHYLFIRPNGLLEAGRTYRVRIAGSWTADGQSGSFDTTLRYDTERLRPAREPFGVGANRVGGIELTRLALPLPSLLPSVNQIGFDSYNLLAGALAVQPASRTTGSALLWVVGAQGTSGKGATRVDPDGGFAFPLFGQYRRGALALNASDVNLTFSFGQVPLRSFDVRGVLRSNGNGFRPGVTTYGQVTCADVPNYSVQLRIAGVCNQSDTLAAFGTMMSGSYGGEAVRRPAGLGVGAVSLERPAGADGSASVDLTLAAGARYPATDHRVSILLVDAGTGAPVGFDYYGLTQQVTDAAGNVVGARLTIPAGTELPQQLRVYVIADAFPLAVTEVPAP